MFNALASCIDGHSSDPDDLFSESNRLQHLHDSIEADTPESAVFDDLAIGLMAIEGRNYSTAVTSLTRVTDADPTQFALAQEWLGTAYLKSGQPELAIDPLRRAIQLNEQLGREPLAIAECHFSLGLAFLHSGRGECALSEFQAALHCEPDWGTVLMEIARVHALRNRILESAAALDEAGQQDEAFLSQANDDCDFETVVVSLACRSRQGTPHLCPDFE